MKIGFVGLGKLGLPAVLAIESKGHEVAGYDISEKVRNIVITKKIPYKEEGAQILLDHSNIKILQLPELVDFAEIIFVAVQTPHEEKFEGITRLPDERRDFDYTYLENAVKEMTEEVGKQGKDKIVVIVSTVLPTTIETRIKPLLNEHVKLCYNPFFIAMGTCIHDFLHPEFVLFGVDDQKAFEKAKGFYETITNVPFYATSIRDAELIKVAYNTYISMKLTFVNTIMEICHKIGADVDQVTNALKLANVRLMNGKYLSGGMGDGGACHPRDNIALSWLSKKLNLSFDLFENIILAREKQTEWLADIFEKQPLPKVILGKSYKPESNLTYGSPSLLLKSLMTEKGHEVLMYDPNIDRDDKILEEITKKPHTYFIGTMHKDFASFNFPKGSVVIDPFRYIPDREGVQIIRVGKPEK